MPRDSRSREHDEPNLRCTLPRRDMLLHSRKNRLTTFEFNPGIFVTHLALRRLACGGRQLFGLDPRRL